MPQKKRERARIEIKSCFKVFSFFFGIWDLGILILITGGDSDHLMLSPPGVERTSLDFWSPWGGAFLGADIFSPLSFLSGESDPPMLW